MGNTKNYAPFFLGSVFQWTVFITVGVASVAFALVIHELGHAVSAHLLGWEVTELHLWGISLLPELGYVGFGDGYMGRVAWTALGTPTSFERAFVLIMGSGATLLLSAISISALYLLRPLSFLAQSALFFLSLLYLDMVTYTFGLRFTGEREPLEAARLFGIGDSSWIILNVILLLVFTALITMYFLYFKRLGQEKV